MNDILGLAFMKINEGDAELNGPFFFEGKGETGRVPLDAFQRVSEVATRHVFQNEHKGIPTYPEDLDNMRMMHLDENVHFFLQVDTVLGLAFRVEFLDGHVHKAPFALVDRSKLSPTENVLVVNRDFTMINEPFVFVHSKKYLIV